MSSLDLTFNYIITSQTLIQTETGHQHGSQKWAMFFNFFFFLVLLYFLLKVKNNWQNGGKVIKFLLIICNDEMIHFFGNFLQTTFVLCLSLVFVNIQLERKLCNLINYVNAFCYFVLSSMSYSNYLNRKKKVYQNGFWWYSLMVLINFFFFFEQKI